MLRLKTRPCYNTPWIHSSYPVSSRGTNLENAEQSRTGRFETKANATSLRVMRTRCDHLIAGDHGIRLPFGAGFGSGFSIRDSRWMDGARVRTARVRTLTLAIVFITALASLQSPGACRTLLAEELRAGVGVCDILADGSEATVHDPIRAKALVVSDGKSKIVIVALDVVAVTKSLVAEIRGHLRADLDIEPSSVLVSATHNHHTQQQVAHDLPQRVFRAVQTACDSMVPVNVGAGVGREDRIMMNRRLLLQDGTPWTIRRANPSPPDAELAKLGPTDPEIGVLRLDRKDGRVLAVLYNYAVHAYAGAPNGGVTADIPGAASRLLEETLGPGTVAIFLQGAAGDITPIRYKDVDSPPPTQQLGMLLGLSTLKAVHQIRTKSNGTVCMVTEKITLPRRHDLDARIAALVAEQERILQFFTGVGCGAHGAGTFLNFKSFVPLYLKHTIDPKHPAYASYLYLHEANTGQESLKHLDAENRKRLDKYRASIRQMEALIRLRSNLKILQRQKDRNEQEEVPAEIQALRIGDFAMITFPGEPFAEIGLRIKKRAPFEHAFVAGYANGHIGYGPTADSYETSCYENCLTPLAPDWQGVYETSALKLLSQLADSTKEQ